MGLKVFKECCKNCLMSKNRIVSSKMAKEIVLSCTKKQTHFICHKTDNVVCKSFYDKLGYVSQMVRIAQRLNAVEFVEQPKNEKLPTYDEMSGRKVSAK